MTGYLLEPSLTHLEGRMDTIVMDLGKIEREVQTGQQWSRDFMESVRGMEVDIGGLMALTAFLRGEVDWMRVEMDALLGLNARMVDTGGEGLWKQVITWWEHCGIRCNLFDLFLPDTFSSHFKCSLKCF